MGRGPLLFSDFTHELKNAQLRCISLKVGSAFEPQAMFNGQGVLLFYRIWLGDWTQWMVQIHSQW
jgi:hypothetical protein